MKRILKISAYIVLTPVVLFALFLAYSTISNYKPAHITNISLNEGTVVDIYDTLNIFNWNIGYGGLGDDMSFFYDGGEQVRTSLERTNENLQGIISQIKSHDSIDFYMLQELDINSRRSYKHDQYKALQNEMPDYFGSFACNFKVFFIPVPVSDPMGKTHSGIASYSKYQPFEVNRHAFEGNYSWPKGLFLLDRCFMVQKFYTSNGKELFIINTHNSAYDDGTLRLRQMKLMREFLLAEYDKGNYVIVGGDWNQNPPKKGESAKIHKDEHLTRIRIAENFMPEGWNWVYCENIPTNRMINKAYNPETTITTTIDFFLISPNIQKIELKNIDLAFKHSDHQPVVFSFGFID